MIHHANDERIGSAALLFQFCLLLDYHISLQPNYYFASSLLRVTTVIKEASA